MLHLPRRFTIWRITCMLCLTILPLITAQPAAAVVSVADIFRDYYNQYQGMRVLGNPLTELTEVNGYPAQYFEKGRIEDHRRTETNPLWVFMYGRLTEELMQRSPAGRVSGMSLTYAELSQLAAPQYRRAAPFGFTGGVVYVAGGVFVPYDARLGVAPGYVVPLFFWDYINRAAFFPGGWLHDVGLPMTDAFTVATSKNGVQRSITVQAFERAVLTYDSLNPPEWQVERANIGADAVQGSITPQPTPQIPELQQARDTLITFFQLLHDRRYSEAVNLYGGDYERLRERNPSINPFDYPALLQAACEKNNYRCLNVRAVVEEERRSSHEFRFVVEFKYDDGARFEEDGRARFTYHVVEIDTVFFVQELPVHVD